MKKEGKKAQFTVFVIVGIMMMFIVFFMIYVVSQISQIGAQRAVRQAISDTLDSATINYYIQTCLDSATTQATDELMLQGGVLYQNQGGPHTNDQPGITHIPLNISFDDEINVTTNVSYSITKKNNCPIIDQTPPRYPKANTSLSLLFDLYESRINNFQCSADKRTHKDFSGFFGQNNFTRLCTFEKNNSKPILGVSVSPCYTNWLVQPERKRTTIEDLLEQRIRVLLKECIDTDLLNNLLGANIKIDEQEELEIDLFFNRNTFSVRATYPFIATIGAEESIQISHDYNYASSLRLVRLHNYALSLLAADVKDIFFNLSSPVHQRRQDLFTRIFPNVERYYDPYFEIKIINVNCEPQNLECQEYKYDRVLIIKDKLSYVGGRPLTLATAIQNRKPALDIIGVIDPQLSYNILVGVGEQLIINPQGYDPDDRNLTYKYFGWKEDYTKECGLDSDNNFECTEEIPLQEPILTNSELFQETRRAVNYTTNETDVGLHSVLVYVYDVEGLQDYQEVKILVFDIPSVTISASSPYTGVPDNVTSIEDPIKVIGELDTPLMDYEFINYTWIIRNHEGQIINQTSIIQDPGELITEIEIPVPKQNLIQIIKPELFNLTGFYTINLKAGIKYTDSNFDVYLESEVAELTMNVRQCIPFTAQTKIYPYTTNSNPPFLFNHTCCEGNLENPNTYKFFPNTHPCYKRTYYGQYHSLIKKAEEEQKNGSFEYYSDYDSTIKITPESISQEQLNNIFRMNLTRFCDAKRGNMCAGNITAELFEVTTCLYNASLLEQCEGPSLGASITKPNCNKYSTNQLTNAFSFEVIHSLKNSLGETASGVCQNTPTCSTIGQLGYNNSGLFLCTQAYCNQGKCSRTFAEHCTCDANCGAECYPGNDLYFWEENTCKYGECTNCLFSQENTSMKCAQPNNYCYNEKGFCYYEVECTNTGGTAQRGEYCQRNQLFTATIPEPENPENTILVNVCIYGDAEEQNACDQQGKCQHTETLFTCSEETEPQCYENQEPICINEDGTTPPITYNHPEDPEDITYHYPIDS